MKQVNIFLKVRNCVDAAQLLIDTLSRRDPKGIRGTPEVKVGQTDIRWNYSLSRFTKNEKTNRKNWKNSQNTLMLGLWIEMQKLNLFHSTLPINQAKPGLKD